MSNPSTPEPAPARAAWEFTAAFLLLRLFLGLRTLLAGVDKFEAGGLYSHANYVKNMDRMATGITGASFLPLWMTKLYAGSLGYLLLAIGAALLLGMKTRISLVLMGLVYLSLGFGLMAVQEDQGVSWIAIYMGLVAGALLLARHDRFALWPDRRE
jgi:thiosulfate dehydrogenase (quinone) large subunit